MSETARSAWHESCQAVLHPSAAGEGTQQVLPLGLQGSQQLQRAHCTGRSPAPASVQSRASSGAMPSGLLSGLAAMLLPCPPLIMGWVSACTRLDVHPCSSDFGTSGALRLPAVPWHAHALEERRSLTLTCQYGPDVAALALPLQLCAVVEQPPGSVQSLLRHNN